MGELSFFTFSIMLLHNTNFRNRPCNQLTTFPCFINAFTVTAWEHIRFAFLLIAVFFVRSVSAIRVVVAFPSVRDTLLRVLAPEFVISACGGCDIRMIAILLVGTIVAIVFAIALPYLVDASPIGAFEFVGITLGEWTRHFIAAISTIFVVIAHKVLRNAFSVRFACKHV